MDSLVYTPVNANNPVLTDIDDIVTTGKIDGSILRYNTTLDKWIVSSAPTANELTLELSMRDARITVLEQAVATTQIS